MTASVRLALFDLDNTLLTGDSDVLWCEFLMARGVLDRSTFAPRNADMDRRYRAGEATAEEFCALYVSTIAGLSLEQGESLRSEFFREWIRPRIPADARTLVEQHRRDGDVLVMTTATNRYITELTAIDFGIEHLIATEVESRSGIFTGKTLGALNMREGKVTRLRAWLRARDWPETLMLSATFYSDSINDLALLTAVGTPVVVDADAKLASEAANRGWRALTLARS